jgi:hypothetical protein
LEVKSASKYYCWRQLGGMALTSVVAFGGLPLQAHADNELPPPLQQTLEQPLLSGDPTAPKIGNATLQIFMAPNGNNENSGLSVDQPVQSLPQAKEIIRERKPQVDVEVRIAPGTYSGQHVRLNDEDVIPGHTLSFMPTNYKEGDDFSAIESRPKFVGNANTKQLFRVATKGTSGVRIIGIEIAEYPRSAISVTGGTTDVKTETGTLRRGASPGANGNTFAGLSIHDIGTAPTHAKNPEPFGFGGVVLENSSGNTFINDIFKNIRNSGGYGNKIHDIYGSLSRDNTITKSIFEYTNGSPIKWRNSSNGNRVWDNEFHHVGLTAAVSDSYQRGTIGPNKHHPGNSDECPSFNNRIYDNLLDQTFYGEPLDAYDLVTGHNNHTYKGKYVRCEDNDQPRVIAYNNRRPAHDHRN